MVNVITPFSSQKWEVSSKEDSRIRRSLTTKAKTSLIIAVVIVFMIIVFVLVCLLLPPNEEESFWPSYTSHSRLGKYKMAAISSDAAPCAPIGKDILERNGTAVDAAIAVLTCMGAHNPHSMGLGGGFFMLYYNRTEQRAYFLDSRETAPRKATTNMFHGNATAASTGGLSIAVPGELAGYVVAHKRFGRYPWKELFTPTIEMCREGIEVGAHLARALRTSKKKFAHFEAIRNVFMKNGTELYKEGEYIKMPDLARTLEVISKEKMEALYGRSELADSFLKDLKAAGSIIDRIDMQSYIPRFRKPVQVHLRKNTTLYSVSVPGSGGLLAFMMSVLDGYSDIDETVPQNKEKTVLTYHRMVETFKYAYAHRNQLEDSDSVEMEKLLEKLSTREYADYVRNLINDSATYDDPLHYGVQWGFVEDHGTAHLSIVAPNGDAVSVTSTINQYFGSKVLSPSTGIVLNDEMDDFSSPNITNNFNLPPTPMNRIRPRKRPMSSMAPMILVDDEGDVKLVLGGNGGTMITSSVLQVAARVLFFGEGIKESIDAPRIHHQLAPNVIRYEKSFPRALVERFHHFGHQTELWNNGMMSIIMGIMRDSDGQLYANADYRKKGDVAGF